MTMLTTTTCPEEGCVVLKKLRAPLTVKYEPAGKWFETYCLRRKQRETLSTGSNGLLSERCVEKKQPVNTKERIPRLRIGYRFFFN